MLWLRITVIWTVVTAVLAINRPVYKVVLAQKGFAQFLQYDVETPPLIEFTFCTWIRLYSLENEQTIFTYIVNGNRNMVRLWVDSSGRNVQLTINGWLATTSPIEMVKDVWKHVCVSYQSDFGAWALYVDARLVTCGASQALNGFILPPGGSVIIGYGTTDSGSPSGINGEIFGVNMILASTIERNHTMKLNPRYKQKLFQKNKVRELRGNAYKYVVLSELKGNKIRNTFENNPFIKLTNMTTRSPKPQYTSKEKVEASNERDILDFAIPGRVKTTTSDPNIIQFWNLIDTTQGGWSKKKSNGEPFSSGTNDLPSVSEFETPPPPPSSVHFDYFSNKPENDKMQAIFDSKLSEKLVDIKKTVLKHKEPSEIETPPPLQTDSNVYGQWVSSKFAGSVLNHLRNIRLNNKDLIKPPPTIPLYKTSDAFPYSSEFRLTKLRPPAQFQRRNFIDSQFYSEKFGKRRPQFNVQILEDDIRDRILKSHSRIKPMNIDVTNAGGTTYNPERTSRFYRQVTDLSQSSGSSESIEIENTPRPFKTTTTVQPTTTKTTQDYQGLSTQEIGNLLRVLPFLKTLGYLADSDKTESQNVFKKDIYTRSLADGNKWHNTKSFNNDYTPRQVHVEPHKPFHDFESKLAEANKNKHPTVKLKYKHEGRKETVRKPFEDGRALAKNVSSQAEIGNGFVPVSEFAFETEPDKAKNKEKVNTKVKSDFEGVLNKHHFNKPVKIGNALNEGNVIGRDELQKKRSFVGGDARVPDINRYRSVIDKENGNVPPSLSPKVCKNVELYDRVLYIQPDESVDLTYFMSPVKLKNIAIEFIQQNYKMCSLDGSLFEKDPLLYLDWSNTPVRLFGGAYLKTTTDLCGFF